MAESHTFFDLLLMLQPKARLLLRMGVVGFFMGLIFVSLFPKRVSTEALLEVASLGSDSILAMAAQPDMARAFLGQKSANKSSFDAKTYLQFKYLDEPRNRLSESPFLKAVEETESEQYLTLEVRANSHEESEAFLNKILNDLRDWYRPLVTDSLHDKAKQKVMIEEQIKKFKVHFAKVTDLIREIGYSSVLAKEQADLMSVLMTLQAKQVLLETQITPEKIHNFSFVWVRNKTPTVIYYLKLGIVPFLCAALAMLPVVLLVFASHLNQQFKNVVTKSEIRPVPVRKTGND